MTIGFDLGGKRCVVAVTRRNVGKVSAGSNFIDIALDEASKRHVAPVIGFPEKERNYGNIAAKGFKKNLRSTIRQPMKIIGKSLEEIEEGDPCTVIVPNPTATEGGVITPMYKIFYRGVDVYVTPEQAIACMLKHQLKHVQDLKVQSRECCITIPNNCTYAQREGLLAASEIAGLNVLKLVTSTACLSLDYGLLGGRARSTDESATLFIDIGHRNCNLGVVRFFDGGWEIVAIDSFHGFSGEVMDVNMIQFFNEAFNAKYGESFMNNMKSVSKVEDVIDKLKKTLVVNEGTSQSIDYLYQDYDFTCTITREQLSAICEDEVGRFLNYLREFLQRAKERLGDIPFSTIETVGGVTRMVNLRAAMREICEQEIGLNVLSTTLNTDESCARGCVLQCAILSPRFAIAAKDVKDVLPFTILVGRQPSDFSIEEWESCNYEALFPIWHELNKTKTITFKKPKSLRIILVEENTVGQRSLIGWVDVDTSGVELADGESWKKFQVIVDLNHCGLLNFRAEITKSRVELVDVEKKEEVPLTEEEYAEALAKAEEEARQKAEEEARLKAEEEAQKAAEYAEEANEAVVNMVVENPEEANPEEVPQVPEISIPKTKVVTRIEQQEKVRLSKIEARTQFTSKMKMTRPMIQQIKEQEAEMEQFDRDCLLTSEARNNLETYVYDGQGEFADGGTYYPYMTQEEADNFMNALFETEEWLQMDQEDKEVTEYNNKLDNLKSVGDVFEIRSKEWKKRPRLMEQMKKQITMAEVWSNEGRLAPEFEHIENSKIEGFAQEVSNANLWLDERQQLHQRSSQNQDPPFYATEIKERTKQLVDAFVKIRTIPKPEPPKEEPPAEAPAEEEKPAAEPEVQDEEMEDAEAAA